MGIKKFNPITNGLREKTVITNDELSPNGALKALTFGKKRGSGRMATGSISVRRRGGGHKRKFRIKYSKPQLCPLTRARCKPPLPRCQILGRTCYRRWILL